MTDLAAAFSSLASEIENFIANNPGSQNQVSLQQSLTKINNIITHLQVLKQTANLITAIGNLASAIGESNPGKIGQSIESLLTTTGF